MIAIEYFERGSRRSFHWCVCDICKSEFKRRSDGRGFDLCIACANKHAGKKRSTHGENNRNSKLHVAWANMLARCRNPNNVRFAKYGGKGIHVYGDWLRYENFKEWATKAGWREELTIDRIDSRLGYSPDNCRFVDKSVQNANRGLICTNSSGFVGVWFSKGAYCARVTFRRQIINIGRFKTMKDAVLARDEKIVSLGWPNELSKIEKYSEEEIKSIDAAYMSKLKELKNFSHRGSENEPLVV